MLRSALLVGVVAACFMAFRHWKDQGSANKHEMPFDVYFYRVGQNASSGSVSFEKAVSVSVLLTAANSQLQQRVVRLLNWTGAEIHSGDDLVGNGPHHVFALLKNEHYFLPTLQIGSVESIWLPSLGRNVDVVTRSHSPRVFTVKNLLSHRECDEIIELAKPRLEASTLTEYGSKSQTYSLGQARTSSTAWMQFRHRALTVVRKRVQEVVRVPMRNAEDLQVLRYEKQQHYHSHVDYFDPKLFPDPEIKAGTNRMLTVLLFLSDVDQGGETNFPYAGDSRPPPPPHDCSHGLSVKPSKGDAVVFYNLQPEGHTTGKGDPTSLHAGCDVVSGVKWAANYWIRNRPFNAASNMD